MKSTHATDDRATRSTPLKPLVRNKKPIRPRDFVSLVGLFAPAVAFGAGLIALAMLNGRFTWLRHPGDWPWELWAIGLFGMIATAGGLADWRFHRTYVTVGPAEHHSHLLALLTGGMPLFVLMACASLITRPGVALLPVIVVALYTTILICYDEFAFHRHRCHPIETLYHRLLTFGNGCAWLAWMQWTFVRGGGSGA